MINSAWIFPGQASQKVGMGVDFYKNYELAKKYFDYAQEIMGYDIKSIIFEGPEEDLMKTENTQPALFIVSVIIGKILIKNGLKPTALAGHSLGEYSALTIAGAFDFNLGLELVKVRSQSMANAGKENKGKMAAIVGLNHSLVDSICSSVNKIDVVVPANYNSPSQVVISGYKEAVKLAMDKAKAFGAKMVLELKVSGAFHSPLMEPAREHLADFINSIEIKEANYPVYTNFDAKPKRRGNEIKQSLIKQLISPVLWSDTIITMRNHNIESFIEIGPGKVLQGLNKRIDRSIFCTGVGSKADLENLFV